MEEEKPDYQKLKEVSKEFFPGGYLTQRGYVAQIGVVADNNQMSSLGGHSFFAHGVLVEYHPTPLKDFLKKDKRLEVRVLSTSPESSKPARDVANQINKAITFKRERKPKQGGIDPIVYRRRNSNSGEELF